MGTTTNLEPFRDRSILSSEEVVHTTRCANDDATAAFAPLEVCCDIGTSDEQDSRQGVTLRHKHGHHVEDLASKFAEQKK